MTVQADNTRVWHFRHNHPITKNLRSSTFIIMTRNKLETITHHPPNSRMHLPLMSHYHSIKLKNSLKLMSSNSHTYSKSHSLKLSDSDLSLNHLNSFKIVQLHLSFPITLTTPVSSNSNLMLISRALSHDAARLPGSVSFTNSISDQSTILLSYDSSQSFRPY